MNDYLAYRRVLACNELCAPPSNYTDYSSIKLQIEYNRLLPNLDYVVYVEDATLCLRRERGELQVVRIRAEIYIHLRVNNCMSPRPYNITYACPTPRRKHFIIIHKIGATPTVENCRAVLKEMPLENCSITAAWRSRGCLTDAIIIQPGGHRSGGGVGAAGGMGEAPPAPSAGKIQPSTTSSAKDGGPTASEVNFLLLRIDLYILTFRFNLRLFVNADRRGMQL